MNNLFKESVDILVTDLDSPSYYKEAEEIRTILEDVNSPVTRSFQEKLYLSVLNKGHIDFDKIPESKGNIRNYVGYPNMIETLKTVKELAKEGKAATVLGYVDTVETAIKNLEDLSSTYEKAFATKTPYPALEYNTYVYFCVEATTALIYSFVEIVKAPDKTTLDMEIKNSVLRADLFYFQQLMKFNKVQNMHGIEYRKMIEKMCENGRDNFTGSEMLGIAAVATALLSIVPITREVIYQIYNFRGKLSDSLELQSKFLELNKTCIDNNTLMTAPEKKKVKDKQDKLAKRLHKLSDIIRVKSSTSIASSKKDIKKDNSVFTIDNIKDEVSDSPFEIF